MLLSQPPQFFVSPDGPRIAYRAVGDGPPVLLLHGYPQTGVMWDPIAPALADRFTLVCPDLRGYGDSDAPAGGKDHAAYAKRAMAADMVGLMRHLGHERFACVGHDRGARVGHRLTLDHADRVTRFAAIDIVPTHAVFARTDTALATAYYHWFFLVQGGGLPERLIGSDPEFWVRHHLTAWSRVPDAFDERAVAAYVKAFRRADVIHGTCEDYRAAAGIDLEHDAADFGTRAIGCPTLLLWGAQGFVGSHYDVSAIWADYATDIEGAALPCGHFVPEECPNETADRLLAFLSRN